MLSWDTIRSSEPYIEIAIDKAMETVDSILGVRAEWAPNTFEELQAIADQSRNECSESEEVDKFVTVLSSLPNRDELTRQLPYDAVDGFLALLLPAPDAFTDEAWDQYLEDKASNEGELK